MHIYALVPTLTISSVNAVLAVSSGSLRHSLDFATTAMVFGFMLKLGAAPVHQ